MLNFFLFFLIFFIDFLTLELIRKLDNISSNASLSKKGPFLFIFLGSCSF